MDPRDRPLCHINLSRGFRGGERQAELLIQELAARGWRQRLVARVANPLAERSANIKGLQIIEIPMNYWAATRALRGSRLIHVHEGRSIYPAWLANRLASVPYIITKRIPNALKTRRLQSLIYRHAGAVAAVSRAVATTLEQSLNVTGCDVIPDCLAKLSVNAMNAAAIRAQYPNKKLIGHIGELDNSHKGQNTIIQVARTASATHPDWQFLLLGRGRDEQAFKNASADLNNIAFVGFVDNVGDYLSAFDLFVFPSLEEGLGSTLLDAMYFGLPIVATNVGGIPEIVHDGENGRLIPPNDPAALRAGINTLLNEPQRYAAIQAANRSAAEHYTPSRIADQYEAVYARLT
jgi:glycosyltransferase involved in cell wall biosynthesis